MSRALRQGEAHLRWCTRCEWTGTAWIDGPTSGEILELESREAARQPDRVDLRSLTVDGDQWRVMIECWAEDGRWLARLVFVAPEGQVWPDARSFEGDSAVQVLSQAFSLPERALTGRLRRAIR